MDAVWSSSSSSTRAAHVHRWSRWLVSTEESSSKVVGDITAVCHVSEQSPRSASQVTKEPRLCCYGSSQSCRSSSLCTVANDDGTDAALKSA